MFINWMCYILFWLHYKMKEKKWGMALDGGRTKFMPAEGAESYCSMYVSDPFPTMMKSQAGERKR